MLLPGQFQIYAVYFYVLFSCLGTYSSIVCVRTHVYLPILCIMWNVSKSYRRTILHLGGEPVVENDIGSGNSCKISRWYRRLSERRTCQLFGSSLTAYFSLSQGREANFITERFYLDEVAGGASSSLSTDEFFFFFFFFACLGKSIRAWTLLVLYLNCLCNLTVIAQHIKYYLSTQEKYCM